VPGSAYYAYKPGLGQGELKLWIGWLVTWWLIGRVIE